MDQEQIHVVGAEHIEAARESARHITEIVHPQLRGDEDVFAGYARAGDAQTDSTLIAISGGGIDMSVSGVKCLPDNGFRFGIGDCGDAETELGDVHTIVETNFRDSAWLHDGLQSLCG
ncbi:hypothetical protein NJBCHELONAE_37560 [Mycobacteroides chelonae]|nr:hypothetical protein NJBCHELONAE_37560 [Mycobacteroides chelonae]